MLISPVKIEASEGLSSSQSIDLSSDFLSDVSDFEDLIVQSCSEMLQLDVPIRQESALSDSSSYLSENLLESEILLSEAAPQASEPNESFNRLEYAFLTQTVHNDVVMSPTEDTKFQPLQPLQFLQPMNTQTTDEGTSEAINDVQSLFAKESESKNQVLTDNNKEFQEDGKSRLSSDLNVDLLNNDEVDNEASSLTLEQFIKKSDEKNIGAVSKKIETNSNIQVVTNQERLADTKLSQRGAFPSQALLTEPQDKISVPVNHAMWAKTLTDRLVFYANKGIQQASIVLDPPELGPLKVDISTDGQGTLLNFSTHHHAIKELIESNMNELRADFASSGMNLVNVNVNQQAPNNHERHDRYPSTHSAGQGSVVQVDLGQKHDGLLSVYV